MDGVVQSFVKDLDVCNDEATLEETFGRWLSTLGVRFFAYNMHRISPVISHNHLERNPQRFIISNYPQKWRFHYFRERYEQVDPVLNRISSIPGVIQWSDIAGSDDLTKKQSKLLGEALDAGLAGGLTFPILTELGESVAISIVPDQLLAESKNLATSLPTVHLLAQCFHQKARKVLLGQSLKESTSRRKALLSPREVEVLTWIAKGKTAWETAQILNISQKSVDFYTETAKDKLYAMNRTHAVVKAIILGLVSLV